MLQRFPVKMKNDVRKPPLQPVKQMITQNASNIHHHESQTDSANAGTNAKKKYSVYCRA